MAKIVLEVEENIKPKASDILVYDAKKECWVAKTKAAFLSDVSKRVSTLEESMAKANENIASIAKIMKEKL